MKAIAVIILSILISICDAQNCVPRKFDEDSIVCVCNSTYCDSVAVQIPDRGKFRTYVSDQSGQRFKTDTGVFSNTPKNENSSLLHLNPQKTYQIIHGFGGAFTDSAGLNIRKLSGKTQEILLQAYYGEDGNRYNLGRVPVGGTDFSTRPYTLDDTPGDIKLSTFSLAKEDNDYKIPYMKKALELNPETKFFAASWTAPPWMKTNNNYRGFLGFLKRRYYQAYAEYLVKFLESYKNEGLPIWAISTGNEPADTYLPLLKINNMGWTASTVAKFIVENLGPTIANSSSNETIIWALDDQRIYLPWYINDIYEDNKEVDKYIAAIAVHWYADILIPPTVYDRTHELYPDKYLIMTEACTGSQFWDFKKVRLGAWHRGESYMYSIIEDLNHWVTGWVDWNLALDKTGGPNWSKNNVDAPIIINYEADEFFKQPMYYAIAHFSKFIPRGSIRVDLSANPKIESVAFFTPQNATVVVLLNKKNKLVNVTIVDPNKGHINVKLTARSFQTIIYQQ